MTLQQAFDFPRPGAAPAPQPPLRRNLVIEAGAGTGKTTAIVGEVLRLMLEEQDLSPERIVLMTFTEKAAGEISDRIHAALAEVQTRLENAAPDETVRWPHSSPAPLVTIPPDRIAACRQNCARQMSRIHLLRSQTIHSFCQSLLRQFPIDAGVDPQFKVIEGFERSLLYEQLYDAWVDQDTRVHPDPSAVQEWEVLLAHLGYLFLVRGAIFSLVERRDLLSESEYDFGDIAEIEDQIRGALEKIRAGYGDSSLDERAQRMFSYLASTEMPERGDVDGWLEFFAPVAAEIRTLHLPKGKRNAPLAEAQRFLRTSESTGRSIYERLSGHRAAMALHALTRRFLSFLDAEKRMRGVLDFDDLLLRTLSLLDDPAVLERARRQYDHIFVDEFQDTDRTQAKIIDRLARDGAGEYVPGKTVVVGDPKQSIYGFRRADPETYFQMTKRLKDAGAEHRVIAGQYRSDPPLLEALNAVFTRLFPHEPEELHDKNVFRPAYHALEAGKAECDRELDARITFLRAEHQEKADQYLSEAEAMARWIHAHRDGGPLDLQRFAILFRRLTELDDYLDVLERHGIDYVLPPTRLFLERRAPVDMLAVLRAIAFPFDRGAQISAARTPYFALADDEIARGVLKADGKVEDADCTAWNAFQTAIAQFRDAAQQLTISGLMDHVIAVCGIEQVYAVTAGGDRAARHLEHLRAIAFDYDLKIGGSVRQFVAEIDRRRNDPDEMEPLLADESRNAVRIMSVHAAKGLEFDTVIIPDLVFPGGGDGTKIFTVEEPRSLVMCQPDSLSAQFRFANGQKLKRVSGLRDEAEARRLFYVAVTRAKTDVVFVCNNTKGGKSTSFSSCLTEAFELDLKTLEFGRGREVRTLNVSGIELRVAFESMDESDAGPRTRRRLADPSLEHELTAGPIEPLEIVPPAPLPRLNAAEAAIARAGASNRESGILLHRVLEVWDGSASMEELLDRLAAEVAATAPTIARVRQRLRTLSKSPMLQRIADAETIGRELPLRIAGADGAILERRIDRLLRENGSEVVIDYKSGAPQPSRVERDRTQVRQYCEAISAMTGRPCEGVLWYIDDEHDVVVNA